MMNFGQSQGGNGGHTTPLAPTDQAAPSSAGREIPYDYVAVFKLQGRVGNRVEDVINISVDGAFVATAVGYSFIPARFPRQVIPTQSDDASTSAAPTIPHTMIRWIFDNAINRQILDPRQYFADLVSCLARNMCHVDFRYNIIDSATGRELQNRSIHNIAGLGEPNGERPFRPFAKPVIFQPRSTIRIVVEELSEGPIFGYDNPNTRLRETSELNIVLHGYKLLGYGGGAV
jgi:hypothetical protein